MSDDKRLRVVLCWHMHQPEYREPVSGQYLAPWSYLHAIKDYSDMAAHLENQEGATAVVNFSPVLLDQIEDYRTQLQEFCAGSGELHDPLLAALAQPGLSSTPESCFELLRACQPLQGPRMLERFAPFRQLAELAKWVLAHPEAGDYLTGQFTGDLLVWCHLAWIGETLRRSDACVQRLMQKARAYTAEDRRELLQVICEVVSGIVPRYRKLAEAGRVEISVSPYSHPIVPLLLDFGAAREAHPDLSLPVAGSYPGGAARAQWQIERARSAHARYFGAEPAGCWPSEGALSTPTLALLDKYHFSWAASGQQVLMHSLGAAQAPSEIRHRPYRLAGQHLAVFFRDDELADRIGFEYKTWHADDAVADLIKRLTAIAADPQAGPGRVVSIVLDGENAWEHYPENAWHFLTRLYAALARDSQLCLTTFDRCVNDAAVPVRPLAKLVAGSWVRGDLTTWIGSQDKNRAWDMLVAARRHCEAALGSGRLDAQQRARLERQLAVCEGSDWFWWPGDENLAQYVARFDRLYRAQLTGLYHLMDEVPPEYLARPFSHAKVEAGGGVMRPAQ